MPDFLKPSPFCLFLCSISKKIEKSQSLETWRKTNSLCSCFDIFHKAVENQNMKARFMSFFKVICRFPRRLCSHHLLQPLKLKWRLKIFMFGTHWVTAARCNGIQLKLKSREKTVSCFHVKQSSCNSVCWDTAKGFTFSYFKDKTSNCF